MSEAVLHRIVRDQDRRQDIGNVIPCLTREERICSPEIPLARTGDRTIYVSFAAVVPGHRKLPVSVSVEQELQITSGCTRRFIKTVAFIDVRSAAQAVTGTRSRDELPEARGRSPGHRRRLPGALDLSQPRDVLRNSLFAEDT